MIMTKNYRIRQFLRTGFYLLSIVGIQACGDNSNDFGLNWQSGTFLDAQTFAQQCATPRSGIDPSTNQPYTDVQGSVIDENNFLRSYSNDTYLWYDEITDRYPGSFNDPLDYFELLKTSATTASGQPKDKFHFTLPSDEWFQLSQSGVSSGYGATFVYLSSVPPREVVVAYTELNTPATTAPANISRGARVLSVDGVDIDNNTQNGIDTLNAGLFPASSGETHVFQIQDLNAAITRTVTLTSTAITSMPVQNVTVLNPATDRVGYLLFNDHIATAETALIDAVDLLNTGAGINDLVVDMRYNGGGFLDIASEFAYMIAGPAATAGQPFETLQFNDKHPVTNPVTGQALSPTPFHTTTQGFSAPAGILPTLNLTRVFVLTGPGTCSASEAIMNSLRGVGVEVIQIGSTTCGKPYGFYPTDNCGNTYFTIQFRGINALNYGDYTDGFSPQNTVSNAGDLLPGCSVADDFSNALGDQAEGRLAAALSYRNTLNCPAASGRPAAGNSRPATNLSAVDGVVIKNPWLQNRILR
jgi:carboxyl-terminal processing protease